MKQVYLQLAMVAMAAGGAATAVHATEVKYMLWDANQQPAYQQCANDFQKANAGITIKIAQTGWVEYWSSLTAGMASGKAPDVFANHLAKYPELAKNNQLEDLADRIVKDKLDTSIYADGLMYVWSRKGKQYGLPKDWDTIAFIVNMDHAKKAKVTIDELKLMTWNPKNGGTFENIIRRLTIDKNGNNALSSKFDKTNVAMYGYQIPGIGDMTGQLQWSHFAVSNGFKYQTAPWDDKLLYDNPKLAETLDYLATLPAKGLSAPVDKMKSDGESVTMFNEQKAAMVPQGSWMITTFRDSAKFKQAWVPLPIGPTVKRASMFNGLADSIWAGSKVKDDAWKWVKYMASPACQDTVASFGVVFPAIKGMPEKAIEVQKGKGIDSSAFLTMAKAKTFLPPMTDYGLQINPAITKAVEATMVKQAAAQPQLAAANAEVTKLSK
jgi:multiple sugar transport system substrate-binding protein